MNSPAVTVIIPCFNQGIFLSDAINSLKAQTFRNWECIIVNDGSTDTTAELGEQLSSEDDRIIIINQKNRGLSGARNTGLSVARGKYIQFLDADDILESDKFKIQTVFLEKHDEIDIVFSDARYFTTENPNLRDFSLFDDKKNSAWISEFWYAPGELVEKFIIHNQFAVNCPLIKKKVFEKVGSFNEGLNALEDWELWLRCTVSNIKMFYLDYPDTMALIRKHSMSMTHDYKRMSRAHFYFRIEIGHLLTKNDHRVKNFLLGLDEIYFSKETDTNSNLLKLALSNKTLIVFFLAVLYLIKINTKIFLSKITPWPMQKLYFRIFDMIKNRSFNEH